MILFMIGDFYNEFEGFLRQMLLRLLEPFPASEGIFWFLNDRWIWNYNWSLCVWEISYWPRVSPSKFYIFIFIFNFFGTFSVLPWAVILYFGKPRYQTGWSWLEGSVWRYTIEVQDWDTGLTLFCCVTCFRVNYLP